MSAGGTASSPDAAHVPVAAAAINDAASVLSHLGVVRTRLEPDADLSEASGLEVRLKMESEQLGGSFKIRGASYAIDALDPDVVQVVTTSAGNHGLGTAYACAAQGVSGRIFVPRDVSARKLSRLRTFAPLVEVTVVDGSYDDAEREGKQFAAGANERVWVSSYNDPRVIAGQGTVGLEIIEQWPEVDTIVVPVGGGGLLSGVGVAARGNGVDVWGVEPSQSAAMSRSLAAGQIVSIPDGTRSIAEGLVGNLDPGSITFEIAREFACGVIEVSEETISGATADLYERCSLLTEPSGAAALGALPTVKERGARRVACVITGGNVDSRTHFRLIAKRMREAGP